MEAIRIQKVVEKDGEILMKGLPFKKGQQVEMIFLTEPSDTSGQGHISSDRLSRSKLIGLWKDREDIGDSAVYARQIRGNKRKVVVVIPKLNTLQPYEKGHQLKR